MATKLISQVFFTLFLACIFLKYFPGTTRADNECQYPCYPPPTGTGTPTTPAYTTPPPPPSQIVSYPPPVGYTPTPTGYYPYNPPPPYGTLFNSPPPPDPILPYFPFYYKKPLHQTDQSAATTLGRSTVMAVAVANLLVFISMFCSGVIF